MQHDWIVGVDGSHDSQAALAWTAAQASAIGGRVRPICSWHVPLPIALLSGRRPVDVDRLGLSAEAAVTAARTIEAVADLTDDVDIEEAMLVEGHPARTLCEHTGPNSIVVAGRRGVSGLRHRVLGSVSQYLATHAAGPVVIVPSEWPASPCTRIVVGFDGSEHARAALGWALAIAPEQATVVAMIALDVIPWLDPDDVSTRHPEIAAAAERRILGVADEVDPRRIAERTIVAHGPRRAFLESFDGTDLVVVGPRGIGGVARAVLGSITTWLLHEAPGPVAVVPSAPPDET